MGRLGDLDGKINQALDNADRLREQRATYTGPPCELEGCSEPTVFVTIAAPGTGSGRECAAGHYLGTCRELTIEDVR